MLLPRTVVRTQQVRQAAGVRQFRFDPQDLFRGSVPRRARPSLEVAEAVVECMLSFCLCGDRFETARARAARRPASRRARKRSAPRSAHSARSRPRSATAPAAPTRGASARAAVRRNSSVLLPRRQSGSPAAERALKASQVCVATTVGRSRRSSGATAHRRVESDRACPWCPSVAEVEAAWLHRRKLSWSTRITSNNSEVIVVTSASKDMVRDPSCQPDNTGSALTCPRKRANSRPCFLARHRPSR